MASAALCKVMRFWTYEDSFIFEPLDSSSKSSLSISRPDGHVSIVENWPKAPTNQSPITVYGIMGMIELLAGSYLIVITQREQVGSLRGAPVFNIKSVQVVPVAANQNKLKPNQKGDEAEYVKTLAGAVNASGLFFSYGADITVTSQKAFSAGLERQALPLWQQAELRFLWNRHLLEPLIGVKGTEPFLIPVMQGSFQVLPSTLNGRQVDITLVARRSVYRIGTRMWRRGADPEGAVANFVETEQILETEGCLASYVQVRGSVPLLWEQVVDLKYKPKIKLLSADTASLVRHMKDLREIYGPIVALDLVNQKGGEARLGGAYAAGMESLKDDSLKYVAFDFHHECGQGRFDRVQLLYEQVAPELTKFGFFLARGSEKLKEQKGVARTNCIDCLDRTNVTQSLLARKALEAELRTLRVLGPSETVKDHSELDSRYKILWANHGDDISVQYSGTGALKGDFVRYGKRSGSGILQDGLNSIMRYYLNNFHDGLRQDGLDLVTGRFTVSPYGPSPFRVTGLELFMSFPLLVTLLLLGTAMTVYALAHIGRDGQAYAPAVALCWGAFTTIILWILKTYGRSLTNRPRLGRL